MTLKLMEELLNEIESELPPLVSRELLSQTIGNLISRRSFANRDALQTGIGVKVKLGRKVAYPKTAVMDYIKNNISIAIDNKHQLTGKR